MTQTPIPLIAQNHQLQTTVAERLLLLAILENSPAKGKDSARLQTLALTECETGLDPKILSSPPSKRDDRANELAPFAFSRPAAKKAAELIADALNLGTSPGWQARILLSLLDKLTAFMD